MTFVKKNLFFAAKTYFSVTFHTSYFLPIVGLYLKNANHSSVSPPYIFFLVLFHFPNTEKKHTHTRDTVVVFVHRSPWKSHLLAPGVCCFWFMTSVFYFFFFLLPLFLSEAKTNFCAQSVCGAFVPFFLRPAFIVGMHVRTCRAIKPAKPSFVCEMKIQSVCRRRLQSRDYRFRVFTT